MNLKAAIMAVRAQILAEGPQIEDEDERIVYVNLRLEAMSHVEFLERISDAFTAQGEANETG